MYLNEFEEKIISNFCKNLNELSDESLLLKWSSGSIVATFDTCFEDIDDDTEEEFHSFVFIVSSKKDNPPVVVSDDNYCLINYKNFPVEILSGAIKVN